MRSRSRSAGLALGLVLLGGGVGYGLYARATRRAAASAALSDAVAHGAVVLRVPRAPGSITLDGDTDDPGWTHPPGPAKTNGFLGENGEVLHPYSQARLVWGDGYLYMALYASDEDIESKVSGPDAPVGPDDDHFHVVFSQPGVDYALDISPTAAVTDAVRHGDGAWDTSWNAGVHASKEIDGSLNESKNLDEEWEIELAIPLAALGLRGEPGENLGLSMHRCDTPKEAKRVCSGWGDGEDGRPAGRVVLQ
jgi:hypothetical protein